MEDVGPTHLVAIFQSRHNEPGASITLVPAKGGPYQVFDGIDGPEAGRDIIGERYPATLTKEDLVQRKTWSNKDLGAFYRSVRA